jgi:hypothetical protein
MKIYIGEEGSIKNSNLGSCWESFTRGKRQERESNSHRHIMDRLRMHILVVSPPFVHLYTFVSYITALSAYRHLCIGGRWDEDELGRIRSSKGVEI